MRPPVPGVSFPHSFIHLQQTPPHNCFQAFFFRRLSRRFGREEGELMSDRPALTDPWVPGPPTRPPPPLPPLTRPYVDLLCQTFALS